jgi:hypothetical protein
MRAGQPIVVVSRPTRPSASGSVSQSIRPGGTGTSDRPLPPVLSSRL